LPGGQARLSRVKGRQKIIYHPTCLFQLFDRVSPNSRVVQSPDDLRGLSSLPLESQQMLRDLVQSHLDSRALSSPSSTSAADMTGASSSSSPSDSPSVSSTPVQSNKRPRLNPPSQPIVISDDESETGQPPSLPNLLEGVKIPEGPPRTYDECSVCLDPPVHPVTLPCSHIFCYLCAKGLVRADTSSASCSLCRQAIPDGYLESSQVLSKASQDLNDTPPLQAEDGWQWFYEGRNGWWRFEKRNNDELEENLRNGKQEFETMICGNLYILDLVQFQQYQKDRPQRKRKIKRDLKSAQCKGVAGLGKRSWAQATT